ncbi:sorbitol dehydrogenase-like [Stegodyphus dumicola]|uniref:sorbitol dehydrogenase-like n=2 Tax=Stegodyphus dumicola TaxID=202533 RepID=UPI0015AFDB60|nr:sorbitol dehydrogenase-like [Stegodyphus dumicola]
MANDNLTAIFCRGELRLENKPVPEPAADEVLIGIHSVGICGSDIHCWKKGRICSLTCEGPLILGHESSGTIVKVGDKVQNLKPGDRVCIEFGRPCKTCEFCKSGRYNLCELTKFGAPFDGSLSQYYCQIADFCFKLPDNVTLEEGALIEPLAVAVHACQRAAVTAGKSVLICGAGAIGLLNLLTCKAMGVTKICITDISEDRLKVAKKLGASHQISAKGNDILVLEEVLSKLGGPPDITIECCGAESSIRLGILVTKRGGVLVLVGVGAPEIKIPIFDASIREIDIRGVYRYTNCYPIALQLVASGLVDVKPLITHHFKLQEVNKAFETAHSGADGAIKVLIHCSK